ncbi:MAG: hypothetical protein A2X36_09145 [Elusimicrobia bacterium GWA2_69_24]|nr:MAG: hypothetical protein A2X36_09145 [Elusimicrobia bacterium GWA2_69_24]
MLEAIASARATVHLETYMLKDDRTGWRFAEALGERARAGVQVRVIFDSAGSIGMGERFLQHLRNNGVQLLEFHPMAPWRRRWAWTCRDHRKLLVVDGRIAFCGGINISDDFADPAEGGGGWHDLDASIEGPAARELDRLFRTVWYRETRRWFTVAADPGLRPGASRVQVAANQQLLLRRRIRRALLHALRAAETGITIATAYFIPDRGIRRALYDAARRDVRVSILVPEVSDVEAVNLASRRLFESHLRHGLRLFAWPKRVLHAKAAAVDRRWASIGSYNFTHRSLAHNLEVNMHVLDPEFAGRLDDVILRDAAASREIVLDRWLARPALEKVLERFCYLFRYWF